MFYRTVTFCIIIRQEKQMKRILIPLMLLVSVLSGLGAAAYYDTGSQIFTITAGVSTPMSFTSNGESMFWPGTGDGQTHHTIGGIGALSYQIFVNPYLAIGGELGYQFDFSRAGEVCTNVPITAKLTYVPLQGDFEIPISLGVGADYISYDSYSKITLGLTFEVGFRYYFTDSWGVGVNAGLLVVPELYFDDMSKTSVMTYIPTTLSVTYRH